MAQHLTVVVDHYPATEALPGYRGQDPALCTETAITEALVFQSAARMAAVADKINAPLEPIIPGFQTRILDGNHLAATDHRPAPLRTIGGGALPGQALVEYDAERGMIARVYLSEDGHAQERDR